MFFVRFLFELNKKKFEICIVVFTSINSAKGAAKQK